MLIELPDKVVVQVSGQDVTVTGPKGSLQRKFPPEVTFEIDDRKVRVRRKAETRRARAMHGLARALLNNMVVGVSVGFTRGVEINGVGYRAEVKGSILSMALGYSHPIEFVLPEGITAKVEKNQVSLSGIDREKLGQLVAVIRDQRPPEPYKAKGVKYVEEKIRRKVGKAGVGG